MWNNGLFCIVITGHCLMCEKQCINQWLNTGYPDYWRCDRKMTIQGLITYHQSLDVFLTSHYNVVIMSAMASQITSLTIVYSTVYSGANQRKHQSSASLAFVRGTHRWPINSPHKWPVTRKMFPFDDGMMWHNVENVTKNCAPHALCTNL